MKNYTFMSHYSIQCYCIYITCPRTAISSGNSENPKASSASGHVFSKAEGIACCLSISNFWDLVSVCCIPGDFLHNDTFYVFI